MRCYTVFVSFLRSQDNTKTVYVLLNAPSETSVNKVCLSTFWSNVGFIKPGTSRYIFSRKCSPYTVSDQANCLHRVVGCGRSLAPKIQGFFLNGSCKQKFEYHIGESVEKGHFRDEIFQKQRTNWRTNWTSISNFMYA